MGVQGLWELLAPVGRRVSVETLGSKKLAIDASIWIIQFMKAMRDEKGDMIRNAHLLGFFRRICKLLYLRAKPVFVFDGGTPALKRRTVIARRRQREKAQSNIRKTAEKLLLNHLRTRKLEEIAQNIGLPQLDKKQQNQKQIRRGVEQNAGDCNDEALNSSQIQCTTDKTEEKISADVDVTTEATDAMLAASLIAEPEERGKHFDPSEGTTLIPSDESDDNNDEEYFMLPATHGHVDSAVLASLPPSMQLNLLVQMREQQVAENRQKFQKVAKNPASFSQLQIQAYLKTVAFRREIDGVQKAAAGKGIGGIPSARIASEADREYIFSTSFHGEKHAHAHNQQVPIEVDQNRAASGNSLQTSCHDSEVNDKVSSRGNTHTHTHLIIEIDESSVAAGRKALQTSNQGSEVDDKGGSGESEVEWEDGIPAMDCRESEVEWEDGSGAIATGCGESEVEWEDGSGAVAARGTGISVGSEEIVGPAFMDIEAAELEEAIRRSLEDFAPANYLSGSSQLIIKEQVGEDLKRMEVSPKEAVAIEKLSDSDSEDAFLVRERKRKGKAIISEGQGENLSVRRNAQAEVAGHGVTKPLVEADAAGKNLPDLGTVDHCEQVLLEEGKSCCSEDCMFLEFNQQKESGLMLGIDVMGVKQTSSVSFHPGANDQIENTCAIESVSEMRAEVSQVESSQCLDRGKAKVVQQHAPHCHPKVQEAGPNIQHTVGQKAFEIKSQHMNFRNHDSEVSQVETSQSLDEREEKLVQQHAPLDYSKVQDAGQNLPQVREEKTLKTESRHGNNRNHDSDFLEQNFPDDALIKEAEDLDMFKEREALLKRETELHAEREELSRLQAELQAEMEAEQAELQAGLHEERESLLQEEMELRAAQRKNERNAESVTGEMFAECQELLQMFGLPYIFAPMEAEAQCAFMDSTELVDGVVTEDCDVFLFGGRNVYKNIFDDRKYVETYYMKDIETELGLDQEKLIHMALLLGSDYTEGISGIGIVNAIEIVNAFRGEVGLEKFKDWLDAPDLSLLGKIHQKVQKKQTRKNKRQAVPATGNKGGEEEVEESVTDTVNELADLDDTKEDIPDYNYQQQLFMERHRAVSKNWKVPDSFPNAAVINAYKSPQVDKSSESFSWGRPDLEALRRLCFERFGWIKSKADELLLPVLKEYDRHETQLRLESFYTFNQRFAKIRSTRIQKAVTRITGHRSAELMDLPPHLVGSPPTKKQRNRKIRSPVPEDPEEILPNKSIDSLEEKIEENPDKSIFSHLEEKQAGMKKVKAKDSQHVKQTTADSRKQGRGRGRGRMTGRGGGKAQTKASRKHYLKHSSEVSSTDDSQSDGTADLEEGQLMGIENVRGEQIRRSTRLHQRARYRFSGSEKDGSDSCSDEAGSGIVARGHKHPRSVGNIACPMSPDIGASGSNRVPMTDGKVEEIDNAKEVTDAQEASLADGSYDQQPFVSSVQEQRDTDYLAMGGGFCISDETGQEQLEGSSMLVEDESMFSNDPSAALLNGGRAIARTSLVDGSAVKPTSSIIGSSAESGFALRAIPFLRRKKHKLN